MSIVNSSNYSNYSPLMVWATADGDLFNRTHVANTAQTLESHVHGGAVRGQGLSVLNLNGASNTNIALAQDCDVFIGNEDFTYRDSSGNNHTLLTLDIDHTITANETFSGSTTFSGNVTFSGTVTGNVNPSGSLVAYPAGTTDPTGWFLADGRAVSRSTYATLFSVIGTVYGSGDGSTTFNIPDLRGRTIFGADNMGTSAGAAGRFTGSNNTLGKSAQGEFTHTLTSNESGLVAHGHTASSTDSGHTHGLTLTPLENTGTATGTIYVDSMNNPSSTISGSGLGNLSVNNGTANISTSINNSSSSSAGSGHNTIPLSQIVNWIIKQ